MGNFNYSNIPNDLKNLNRWVLWKKRDLDNGKTTKVPINAKNGYGAKSNDETTWCSFEEALSKCEYYHCNGLGFMLGNGYFGVDIDHAIDNKELIDEFVTALNSYTEISQSGTGIHIICKGVLPQGNRRKGNIEMYDNARFFALTGDLYDGTINNTLTDKTSEIQPLFNKYLADKDEGYIVTRQTFSFLNDNEIIEKAMQSQNGHLFTCLYYGQWEGLFDSQSQADMSFCNLLAFWCSKDKAQMDRIFRSSKLYRDKWERVDYREATLNSAISRCRDVYNPSFTGNQVYDALKGVVVNKKDYDLNDTGNAKRFVDRFGETIRYNVDNKCWMVFDGKTWERDIKQVVKTQADILIDEMKSEALKEQDKTKQSEMLKNVKHLSSSSGKEAMLKEAIHIGTIPVVNADFDKNDYLLNCKNGVVDLKTGELLQHDKKLMLSKNTNVDVDMEHEPKRWIQFLHEIFSDNEELIEYVWKSVGYTLTGDTKDQCFYQCYGDGSNGKSVFFDIVYSMLGEYALNSQVDSILAKNKTTGANSDIARMNGARFVRTNEPDERSRFNEGLIKQLVGGDVTTARFLYGGEFDFIPHFKLWIATNYKIQVSGTDGGIWRRQRLIPFLVKFEGDAVDLFLTEKLKNELPQILGWAVKGCLKWQKERTAKLPAIILEANKQYKQENDVVAKFVADCCRIKTDGKEKASEVFAEFKEWDRNTNEQSNMTQTKFGIEMGKKFPKDNHKGYVEYTGFVLKKHDTSYVFIKN